MEMTSGIQNSGQSLFVASKKEESFVPMKPAG